MSGPYGDFHGLRTEIGDLSAVLVMLAGIVWVFRAMRRGEYNETELERQLDNRGFFYRFFGITATSPHGSATAKGQP